MKEIINNLFSAKEVGFITQTALGIWEALRWAIHQCLGVRNIILEGMTKSIT